MKQEDEIQAISAELNAIRNRGGRVVFPLDLKLRVLSLLREHDSMLSLCKRLNLHVSQVCTWKAQMSQKSKEPPKKLPYTIKTIPVIPSIPNTEIQNLKQNKQTCPKIFFRFFSLKISVW